MGMRLTLGVITNTYNYALLKGLSCFDYL